MATLGSIKLIFPLSLLPRNDLDIFAWNISSDECGIVRELDTQTRRFVVIDRGSFSLRRGAGKRDGRLTKNEPLLIETRFNIGLYHSTILH